MHLFNLIVVWITVALIALTIVLRFFAKDSFVVWLYISVHLKVIMDKVYLVLIPFFCTVLVALWSHDMIWMLWGLLYCVPWSYVVSLFYLNTKN